VCHRARTALVITHTLRSTQGRQNWRVLQSTYSLGDAITHSDRHKVSKTGVLLLSTYSLGDANTHSDQHRVSRTGVFYRARTALVMQIHTQIDTKSAKLAFLQNMYSLGDANTHSDQHRVGKTGVCHRARTALVMQSHTQISTESAKLACVTEQVQPWQFVCRHWTPTCY